MDNLGIGVMLSLMKGNDREMKLLQLAQNKTIVDLKIEDNELRLFFAEGGIAFFDDGQSCCEYRHMHTDDDLDYYKGSEYLGAEIKTGPDEEDKFGGLKESQFLEIKTNRGSFVVVNYNEHNGYYGGFALSVKPITSGDKEML